MEAERPQASRRIVPALGWSWLTSFYDPVIALTLRERRFKTALLEQAGIDAGQKVLDLGCGTGTLALWAKRMQPEAELTGIDADDRVLSAAIRKSARSGLSGAQQPVLPPSLRGSEREHVRRGLSRSSPGRVSACRGLGQGVGRADAVSVLHGTVLRWGRDDSRQCRRSPAEHVREERVPERGSPTRVLDDLRDARSLQRA